MLCTKSEYALVRASLPSYIGALTPAARKRDTKRARTLRDKYRKLAERQKREAKGGGAKGPAKTRGKRPAAGAANTKLKAQVFAEALARYEAASKQASKKPVIKSKIKAKAKPRPPGKKTKAKQKAGTGKKAIREKAAAARPAPEDTPEKKPARKKKRTKSRVGKGSFAAELALKQGRMRRSGTTRIRTHVSARGRRQQARRDSRSR